MVCEKLKEGFSACNANYKRYEQNVMLVNFDNVKSFSIDFPEIEIKFNGTPYGYEFKSSENGNVIFGYIEKEETSEGLPEYNHGLRVVLKGVGKKTKEALKKLDFSNYFGIVKYSDGTNEVFGFENGLKTDDYTASPAESGGAFVIPLISYEPENIATYVIKKDIFKKRGASFNNDFNNDFDIKI